MVRRGGDAVSLVAGTAGGLVVAIWLVLLFARAGWWRATRAGRRRAARPRGVAGGDRGGPRARRGGGDRRGRQPGAQDYPGDFRVIVVDDGSSDGTADVAQASWRCHPRGSGDHRPERPQEMGPRFRGDDSLAVLPAAPLAAGWTGKLVGGRARHRGGRGGAALSVADRRRHRPCARHAALAGRAAPSPTRRCSSR